VHVRRVQGRDAVAPDEDRILPDKLASSLLQLLT
jgi:hypothetical protein